MLKPLPNPSGRRSEGIRPSLSFSPQNVSAVRVTLHVGAMRHGETIQIGISEVDTPVDDVTEEGRIVVKDG